MNTNAFIDFKLFKSRHRLGAGLLGFASLLSLAATPATALAQAYPNKPVKVIVTYPPGGGTDVLARLIEPGLSENLGQPVIIDNRGGAGGTIGAMAAARAPADGYNLLFISTLPHTAVAGLYPKLQYDPIKDFTSVGTAVTLPYVIVVNPSVPANTLADLIALARSKPGVLNYESAGVGSSTHLIGELFKSTFKLDIAHIPFKGGGPGVVALMGGQVQVAFENLVAMMPYIKAGKLRALAVTTKKRSQLLPDVPTVAESGYPDFEVTGQFGYVVPAGTPRDIVMRLNAGLKKAMASPKTVQQLKLQGGEPVTSTPEEFDAMLKAESAKWVGIINNLGIKAE
jgi:tripartite-type tricarboxylate transporter receptor subunit TctC